MGVHQDLDLWHGIQELLLAHCAVLRKLFPTEFIWILVLVFIGALVILLSEYFQGNHDFLGKTFDNKISCFFAVLVVSELIVNITNVFCDQTTKLFQVDAKVVVNVYASEKVPHL